MMTLEGVRVLDHLADAGVDEIDRLGIALDLRIESFDVASPDLPFFFDLSDTFPDDAVQVEVAMEL